MVPLFGAALLAHAANYTWDIAPGTTGTGNGAVNDGSGTWDGVTANWTPDGGLTDTVYGNLSGDTVTIGSGGPGGTLASAAGGVTVGDIVFGVTTGSGYTLSGGPITFAGDAPTIRLNNTAFATTISTSLAGSEGLTYTGSGVLLLNASSTYSGGTTIESGTIIAGASTAFGTGSVTAEGGSVIAGAASVFGTGALTVSGGTVSANYAQALAGNAVTIATGGTLTTSNASSSTLGDLVMNGGTLSANAVNASGNWILGGSVSTSGFGTTSVISGGSIVIKSNTGTVFDIGAGDMLSVASTLLMNLPSAGGNTLTVIKNGTGTLDFSGSTTTLNISVTVNAGTLILGDALQGSGPVTINAGATIVSRGNPGAGSSYVYTINTGGLLTMDASNVLASCPWTMLPSVMLDGGTMSVTGTSSGYVNWMVSGSISTAGTGRVSQIIGGSMQGAGGSPQPGGIIWNIGSGDTLNVSAKIISSGSAYDGLVKNGSGTLVLTGANTYAAITAVNAGRLITGNVGALGKTSVTVSSGAILQIGDGTANAVTLASGATLTVSAGGRLVFQASDSLITLTGSGSYTLTGGILDLNNVFNSAGTYTLITGGTGGTDYLSSITGYDASRFGATFSQGVLTLSAVPEPSAYGLAGALVFAAGILRRRRCRASSPLGTP